MPRPTEGPKSPTPEECDQLVDLVNYYIQREEKRKADSPSGSDAERHAGLRAQHLERLVEVLDWASEQVNKRRLYSKKFQLKDKERTRLLKERLGEEYTNVLNDARKRAENKLFEEVANGEPDKDDLALLQQEPEEE